MIQITQQSDLVGKTITGTGYADNTFALFFNEDNEFAIFRGGYQDVELMKETYSLKPTTSNCMDLRDLGVISEEEYKQVWMDAEKEREVKFEEDQRLLYEQLKTKYEKSK